MDIHMLYEVLLRGQHLAAVWARELAALQMYAVYVAMQIELRGKGLGTVGANEALRLHIY